MGERSHTAGAPLQVYQRRRQVTTKAADWFATAKRMRLPRIAGGDTVRTLTLQDEKRFDHMECGRSYLFSERDIACSSLRLPHGATGNRNVPVCKTLSPDCSCKAATVLGTAPKMASDQCDN
jgi:hypothetical protein